MFVTLIIVHTVHCLKNSTLPLAPLHNKPCSTITYCLYVCQTMSVIYHRLCNKSSTTDGTSGALTAYLFGLSQAPRCLWGLCFSYFFFFVEF